MCAKEIFKIELFSILKTIFQMQNAYTVIFLRSENIPGFILHGTEIRYRYRLAYSIQLRY